MTERVQRVARMEAIYDEGCRAVEALLAAAEGYLAQRDTLQELTDYYQSPQWLSDFDAEQAGLLPRDLKRGILTEDAIYDLLTDESRMKALLRQLLRDEGVAQE